MHFYFSIFILQLYNSKQMTHQFVNNQLINFYAENNQNIETRKKNFRDKLKECANNLDQMLNILLEKKNTKKTFLMRLSENLNPTLSSAIQEEIKAKYDIYYNVYRSNIENICKNYFEIIFYDMLLKNIAKIYACDKNESIYISNIYKYQIIFSSNSNLCQKMVKFYDIYIKETSYTTNCISSQDSDAITRVKDQIKTLKAFCDTESSFNIERNNAEFKIQVKKHTFEFMLSNNKSSVSIDNLFKAKYTEIIDDFILCTNTIFRKVYNMIESNNGNCIAQYDNITACFLKICAYYKFLFFFIDPIPEINEKIPDSVTEFFDYTFITLNMQKLITHKFKEILEFINSHTHDIFFKKELDSSVFDYKAYSRKIEIHMETPRKLQTREKIALSPRLEELIKKCTEIGCSVTDDNKNNFCGETNKSNNKDITEIPNTGSIINHTALETDDLKKDISHCVICSDSIAESEGLDTCNHVVSVSGQETYKLGDMPQNPVKEVADDNILNEGEILKKPKMRIKIEDAIEIDSTMNNQKESKIFIKLNEILGIIRTKIKEAVRSKNDDKRDNDKKAKGDVEIISNGKIAEHGEKELLNITETSFLLSDPDFNKKPSDDMNSEKTVILKDNESCALLSDADFDKEPLDTVKSEQTVILEDNKSCALLSDADFNKQPSDDVNSEKTVILEDNESCFEISQMDKNNMSSPKIKIDQVSDAKKVIQLLNEKSNFISDKRPKKIENCIIETAKKEKVSGYTPSKKNGKSPTVAATVNPSTPVHTIIKLKPADKKTSDPIKVDIKLENKGFINHFFGSNFFYTAGPGISAIICGVIIHLRRSN